MGHRTMRIRLGVVLSGLLLSVGPVLAQGLDGERFAPAAGAAGGFLLERPVVPAHLGYGLGLFLHLADDALLVRDRQSGETVATALDTAVSMDLLASLGLFDFAELAVHLPVRLVYEGEAFGVGGVPLQAASGLGRSPPGARRSVCTAAATRRPASCWAWRCR